MLLGLPLETEILLYYFLGATRSTRLASCSQPIYLSYCDWVEQEAYTQFEAFQQKLGKQKENLQWQPGLDSVGTEMGTEVAATGTVDREIRTTQSSQSSW